MREFVTKAMRLQKPQEMRISLRRCVFDWLVEVSEELKCSENVLARGILEDAYDRLHTSDSEEVTPDD